MVLWHYYSGVLRANETRKALRAKVIMNIIQILNCYLWKKYSFSQLNQVKSLQQLYLQAIALALYFPLPVRTQ